MAYFPEVSIKKNTSPIIIGKLTSFVAQSTLASAVTTGDTVINVVSAAGMIAGNIFFIVDPNTLIVEQFTILSIATNAITVDRPCGNDFASGLYATAANDNWNVNGSVTPVKFNFKTGIETINARALITRIIITMQTSATWTVGQFGDQTALTKGIYLTKTFAGGSTNYWNAKTNLDLANFGYDIESFPSTAPSDEGLRFRLTFTRMGANIELMQNEDLELWVQDDLTGLIKCSATIEGTIE